MDTELKIKTFDDIYQFSVEDVKQNESCICLYFENGSLDFMLNGLEAFQSLSNDLFEKIFRKSKSFKKVNSTVQTKKKTINYIIFYLKNGGVKVYIFTK